MHDFSTFTEPWIKAHSHSSVVALLKKWGLIKHDPTCNLPLRSGKKTDLYVNLRNARNHPHAITYLARIYEPALRHLQLDDIGLTRFVEVPDAVSCIAGPLSIRTNIPYLTIREQPKPDRVSEASVIGTPECDERVCIVDDVITDGSSKIPVFRKCLEIGLHVVALVVLVDRDEGWRERFRAEEIDLPVWAGMTLNDVRRHL